MTVGAILQKTGQTAAAVETLVPTQTVREAVAILAEKKIGVVLIVDDQSGNAVGILSERDVVRVLGTHDTAALDMPVSDVMTPNPIMCERQIGIDVALKQMTEKRCRHLPVLDNGVVIGVISARDIMLYMVESATKKERERIVAMIALA